jgi:hypothetical protein
MPEFVDGVGADVQQHDVRVGAVQQLVMLYVGQAGSCLFGSVVSLAI